MLGQMGILSLKLPNVDRKRSGILDPKLPLFSENAWMINHTCD